MEMEFLKLTQKYLNRYINANDFHTALAKLDSKQLSSDQLVSFSALVTSVEEIIKETTDAPDELIKKELKQSQDTIDYLEKIIQKNTNIPPELKDELERMRKNQKQPRDNFDRWTRISDAIKENKFYKGSLEDLSDSQLLELIAEDISAPRPIVIDAKKFDQLVQIGIKEKARESLWRLALNYHHSGFNLQQIADCYIEKEDTYYLTELISAVGDTLDNDKIISQLASPQMIKDFLEAKPILTPYITPEQFAKLEEKLD